MNYKLLMLKDYIKYSFVKSKVPIPETSELFSAMSFNIRKDTIDDGVNKWQNRKDDVVSLLINSHCHVMGLQEVMPHMFKFITSKLNYRYDSYGINSFYGVKLNRRFSDYELGNAILWDKTKYSCITKGVFWLSDTPTRPSCSWGNTEPRSCVYVILRDIQTQRIYYIYNTHLDHLKGNTKKMVDLIATRIKNKVFYHNNILMGDLNIDLNVDEERKQLESINFYFLDNTYNHIKDLTFNAWHNKLSKTIDAIYFNMQDIKCKTINTTASDHLPIIIYKTI